MQLILNVAIILFILISMWHYIIIRAPIAAGRITPIYRELKQVFEKTEMFISEQLGANDTK